MKKLKKKYILLLITAIIIIFIKINILYISIFSESMSPTLSVGDKVIAINKSITSIKVNDIIIFKNNDNNINVDYLIKRVIAQENDLVEIRNNKLFVNMEFIANLDEINSKEISILLNKNEFFVLGDNINNSYDSRNYGPISYNQIIGKVIYIKDSKN